MKFTFPEVDYRNEIPLHCLQSPDLVFLVVDLKFKFKIIFLNKNLHENTYLKLSVSIYELLKTSWEQKIFFEVRTSKR